MVVSSKQLQRRGGVGGREDSWDSLNVYVTLWYHYINSSLGMLPEPHCSSYLSQRSIKPHVTVSLFGFKAVMRWETSNKVQAVISNKMLDWLQIAFLLQITQISHFNFETPSCKSNDEIAF